MRVDNQIFNYIEMLIGYGNKFGLLEKLDIEHARNRIYKILGLSEYVSFNYELQTDAQNQIQTDQFDIYGLLNNIRDLSAIHCKQPEYMADLLFAELMDCLLPRNSEESRFFWQNYEISPKTATNEFYERSILSGYIRSDRISKNIQWKSKVNKLVINVNLSKPERSPEEIEAMRDYSDIIYPRCMLCKENIGFEGGAGYPPRQNLRAIALRLGGEQWLMQYSPYSYYEEHAIVLSAEHRPMQIDHNSFVRLLEFVDLFPHYFIGSNADLPVVGGSILSHDHYQAGSLNADMPLFSAPAKEIFDLKDASVDLIDWPMAVLRINSKNKNNVSKIADKIFHFWINYNDEKAQIIARSSSSAEKSVRHSTVTPIARYNNDLGRYELYIALRNNRESIFHTSPEWHRIKRENIGIIEVLGLAVMPGRLSDDLKSKEITRAEIEDAFYNMLSDCNVFKMEVGAMNRFLFDDVFGLRNSLIT